MSPAEPTPQRYASASRRYFAATRPAFLSVTLAGCLIGLAAAHADGVALDGVRAVITVLFALLAHAGANVLNDYHDAASGADAANSERIYPFTGGSRFIQNGVLTLRETAAFGYALFALVIPAGLWLALGAGAGLIAIGFAGLVLGWAYSAPPLQLASRGLGEFAVAACWLLVAVGADFVQRGAFAWTPVAAGLSFALLVANLLYINQFPDRAADAAAGKRTLVVRLGADTAKWGYFGIALVAYGWLVLQIGRNNLPQACAAAALTLVLSFHAARQLREHAGEPSELAPAIRLTIAATNLHGLVLAATLAFGAHS
ncbi:MULTISPECIES: prenyltransferase [Aromatoleum]|uniref:Prenyltransferase n=2 Tax=Aromatoleum TaxID=551759 RepID=A0ABX1NXC8_9RHOO|nr:MULTISPECIES: prenyltransferase [Aromatoleum]MCK0507058.1 prenyltransferase [Aromatoleum anaerobium]NMG16458.1 prenyltransferase [Aromatoleum bremense]QTQ32416.1 putative 1,4-dihydroxy-2-naphthoate octaprenyltransferase [Aromatoleum bremense]